VPFAYIMTLEAIIMEPLGGLLQLGWLIGVNAFRFRRRFGTLFVRRDSRTSRRNEIAIRR
jgi:hypothetical protein